MKQDISKEIREGMTPIERREKDGLSRLCLLEDLAEKKTKIYSRLLTDVRLSKEMEELSMRHEGHKQTLCALIEGVAE